MIIPLELELFLILALAGWYQNRWLFLLFVSGETFLAVWFVISLIAALLFRIRLRPYRGEVRLSHMAAVRADISGRTFCRKKIRIRAHITLPTGERRKLIYRADISQDDLSLPVPTFIIGESEFTVDSITLSDAAVIFLFFKKIKKSVIIPVVPDPSRKTRVEYDEAERDFLEKVTVIEKGTDTAHDEIRSFREYRHGDEKRDIHWNISARFGRYYVKEYEGRSEQKESGEKRSNGRESEDGKLMSGQTKRPFNKKKLTYTAGDHSRNADIFSVLIRGILAAGIVLILLLQMTLFEHPFRFEASYPVIFVMITAAALTVSSAARIVKKVLPLSITLVAVIVAVVNIEKLTNDVSVFASWLSGTYKYTDSTPYTDLTMILTIIGVLLTVLFFEILAFRGTSVALFAMASSIYIARDVLDVSDDATVSAVLLCVMAVSGLAYMVLADIGTAGRRKISLFLKETDTGHLTGIAVGIASLAIGFMIAGILPQIMDKNYSGSDVLSGRYADDTMNSIFEAENSGIERIAQLYKVSYRVPFDGRVGRQLNQFTGETQLVIKNESRSQLKDDLYLRFFTGRKYDDGTWSGGDPDALREKSIKYAAKKTGLSDEQTENRRMRQVDYFNSGIYTYLQYQHNIFNGKGLEFYSYQIRNADSKNSSLSYDLSKVTVPMGFMSGATIGNGENPSFAVIPSLGSCSADISDTLTDMERYVSMFPSETEESQNVRNNLFVAEVQDGYQKYYSDYYIEVPDEGLDRTRELVEDEPLDDVKEITAYIRYILASHATYSLKARDPVGNTDPVEFFLFNSHKGYCEQFASAACILYRMYGIPARYVSGYRVSPSDFGKDGTANVPDSSAHAWVEIYLPSTGWLPIEMTPAVLPKDAGTDVTGYPTDRTKMIWPEFSEGDLLDIQEEHDWTGRTFRTKTSSANGSTQSQAAEEQKKAAQQASADATDTGNDTSETTGKSSGFADFFEKYRTPVIFILIAFAAAVLFFLWKRIAEYRFRHGGLRAIAARTDRVITREGNFMLPLSEEESAKLTRYFRLLDMAVYMGYSGTDEEVEWAYRTYDEFLTLLSNKLILSRH